MVETFGTHLRFGEATVDLGEPVEAVLDVPGLAIAVLERGASPPRNVFGFEPDGTRRWRIDPPPDDAPADCERDYTNAWVAGEELWVRSTTRRSYRVSLADGSLRRGLPETAVPVEDAVVHFDRPVASFARVDDLTVALLDRTRPSGDGFGEPPGPRNVVALDGDGREVWRIEPLSIEERTDECWSTDEGPRPFQGQDYWDELEVDDGELRAEHVSGTEVAVDPADGSIAIRDVAAVGDRVVFPGGPVVQVPDPVRRTVKTDDLVLAVLETNHATSTWEERNVLAFGREGEQLWRVGERGEATGAFDAVRTIGDDAYLRRPDGTTFGVDLSSGALGERYEPNEVPLPDGVLVFPQAVSSYVAGEDAVVVCVDVHGHAPSFDVDDHSASEADGGPVAVVRDPLPEDANVAAFDASGDRLWDAERLRDGDSYSGVAVREGRLCANTWVGKRLDVDWTTGETSRNTNKLW